MIINVFSLTFYLIPGTPPPPISDKGKKTVSVLVHFFGRHVEKTQDLDSPNPPSISPHSDLVDKTFPSTLIPAVSQS